MRWSATDNRFFAASGQQDPWEDVDRDDIRLYMRRGAPDWGLVALLLGYGVLICGSIALIL